jgi:hypothetical protein
MTAPVRGAVADPTTAISLLGAETGRLREREGTAQVDPKRSFVVSLETIHMPFTVLS